MTCIKDWKERDIRAEHSEKVRHIEWRLPLELRYRKKKRFFETKNKVNVIKRIDENSTEDLDRDSIRHRWILNSWYWLFYDDDVWSKADSSDKEECWNTSKFRSIDSEASTANTWAKGCVRAQDRINKFPKLSNESECEEYVLKIDTTGNQWVQKDFHRNWKDQCLFDDSSMCRLLLFMTWSGAWIRGRRPVGCQKFVVRQSREIVRLLLKD